MINSENALLRGTVLFNVRDEDLANLNARSQDPAQQNAHPPPSLDFFLEWSGPICQNLISGEKTLKLILPIVLLGIFISMYFAFGSAREAFLSLITIPFALIGGVYMVYF